MPDCGLGGGDAAAVGAARPPAGEAAGAGGGERSTHTRPCLTEGGSETDAHPQEADRCASLNRGGAGDERDGPGPGSAVPAPRVQARHQHGRNRQTSTRGRQTAATRNEGGGTDTCSCCCAVAVVGCGSRLDFLPLEERSLFLRNRAEVLAPPPVRYGKTTTTQPSRRSRSRSQEPQ